MIQSILYYINISRGKISCLKNNNINKFENFKNLFYQYNIMATWKELEPTIAEFYGKVKCSRDITVNIINGKKKPIGRDKYTYSQLEANKHISPPPHNANTSDIFIEYYHKDNNKLVCIDFDEKGSDLENSKIFKYINSLNTINCETVKGYHYYVNITNLPEYSCETKVSNECPDFTKMDENGKTKFIELDLLSWKHVIWEPFDRQFVNNNLVTIDWNDIKPFLHTKRMNIKKELEIFDDIQEIDVFDNDRKNKENIVQITEKQMWGYLKRLNPNRVNDYENWYQVGMICHNNFLGNKDGFDIWDCWSKTGSTYCGSNEVFKKYQSFSATSNDVDNQLSYKTLRMWAEQDNPTNKYQVGYLQSKEVGLVEVMNEECAWNVETSEYILKFDNKWVSKKKGDISNHYENLGFFYEDPLAEGEVKPDYINPFEVWKSHKDRRTFLGIVFDPTDSSPGYFNIWDGYKLKKELYKSVAEQEQEEEELEPLIEHIHNVWCKGNRGHTDYVLNWLAMKLQKPHIKIAVTIALQSKEGAGKNVVLDIFREIMGQRYFATCNNINQLTGDFNGFMEGKQMIVLDELTFGGDHKANNRLKNIITDDYQNVNKKNKESYQIRNYADYFITTNMNHFIAVTETSRRFFCLQLDNTWAGVDNQNKIDYFRKIRNIKPETFSKFLYNRDISKYNPRQFERTPLLQRQVEKSWTSDIKWVYKCLETGHIGDGVKWNKESYNYWGMTAKDGRFYHKLDDLFSKYVKADLGAYAQCVPMKDFEAKLSDIFEDKCEHKIHKGNQVISFPNIIEARKCFNNNQQFNYPWGKGLEEISFSDESDSEDE